MDSKTVVFENDDIKVEVYAPPKEHGDAHVHIYGKQYKRKADNPHLKVFIGDKSTVLLK